MNALKQHRVEEATHYLICTQNRGDASLIYYMRCLPIGVSSKSNKTKIIVFGERFYENRDHKKRIRYVNESQLIRIRKLKYKLLQNK